MTRQWTIGPSPEGFIPYASIQRLRRQVVGRSTDMTKVKGDTVDRHRRHPMDGVQWRTRPEVSWMNTCLRYDQRGFVNSEVRVAVGVEAGTQEELAHWVRRLSQRVGNYWV
jgi:hypothetical protein